MLAEYLRVAIGKAHGEFLDESEGFCGAIPGFQGVYAPGETPEACRVGLASALEDWMLFRIAKNLPLPVIDGIDLAIKELV